MGTDEPFTVRTVAVTTAVSLLALFGLVAFDTPLAVAWILTALLNIVFFALAGIGLQIRAAGSTGARSAKSA